LTQVKATCPQLCDQGLIVLQRVRDVMTGVSRKLALVVAAALGLACAPGWQIEAGVPLAVGSDSDGIPSLAPLLKKITPGVVSIAVKGRIGEEQNPLLKDPGVPLPGSASRS
jgi:hypothetical protein